MRGVSGIVALILLIVVVIIGYSCIFTVRQTEQVLVVRLGEPVRVAGLDGLTVRRRHVRWSRAVPLDTHLANIGTRSAFIVLGEAGTHAFLAGERGR